MDLNFALSCGVAFGILTAFVGLVLTLGRPKVALAKRIDEYAAAASAAQIDEKKRSSESGSAKTGAPSSLGQSLKTELMRANMAFTVTEYIFLNVVTTLLGFGLSYVIFRGNLLLTLLGGAAGFYAPRAWLRFSQGRRQAAFDAQLENTLVLLANALRSGHGLMQAIETINKQVPAPMSEELGRVVREFGLGVPLETALANLLRRNPSTDLDLAITTINVSHESGGKLSEVLDTIANTIRDRIRVAGEIRALTSQQRLSALILTFLPGILGLVIFAMNPDYLAPLWQNACGLAMLGIAAILMFIGNIVIRRIVSIQY